MFSFKLNLKYPKFWYSKNLFSNILLPLSWIFILATFLRKLTTRKRRIGKYVICVGNATVGGSGKTILIKIIAEFLKIKNYSFVIISKGYRSSASDAILVQDHHTAYDVGDEAIELRKFGTVISSKNIMMAIKLIDEIHPEIILVDDGMQNPAFHKDCVILAIDSERSFGNGRIMPAGPMRQTLISALSTSDIVVAIGNNEFRDSIVMSQINEYNIPFYNAKFRMKNKLQDIKYTAFCGIGNPDKFFQMLKKHNINVVNEIEFGDHHSYSDEDIDHLIKISKDSNSGLITTEKDAIKLKKLKNLHIAKIDLDFLNLKQAFLKKLHEKLLQKN